ncbi:hypothetical protein NDI56_09545 [Haloarcula sp. S1CR25-12]|uniref:Uncharacterized protein n=1 Tax=Haloarcula saliterrae TaxID=2950534 RepID=A0ABU2FBI4_9EURY|nr:HTH domain-containing protein [Haloarcula sp. S1CR25-12]MDS0259634.1 hypothetical protein [Haloarcula sp. S1CR25-12]
MQGEHQPVADRAELYLRSLLPEGYSRQQASTLDRVSELVDRGVVGERHVEVCGCQVPASVTATRTGVGERIVSRLSAFQAWAQRNDCTLGPAMELRDVDDSLSDTHYRAVRLPTLLLAEYRDGALRCVTPHCAGDTVRTVEDRLAELEAGEPTVFEPLPPRSPSTLPADIDAEDDDTDERALLAQR